MLRKIVLFSAFFFWAALSHRAVAQPSTYVVGVLPVDDESGESVTEILPPGITTLLYAHLSEMPNVQPVLLSPGGLYDPNSQDWIQQFGRKSHVDALLISRLLPSVKINDKRRRLNFAIEVMDVGSGKVSARLTNSDVEVKTQDLFVSEAYGRVTSKVPSFLALKYFLNYEEFEKERLGAAALQLVDWTKSSLGTLLPTLVASPSGPAQVRAGAACPMTLRIRYTSKRGIAKGYSLLVNKTDQSTAVDDGIASFSMASGPLLIRVTIPDPPYGLPTQKLYLASTLHDCAGPQNLSVDIGAAGEAYLRWEQNQ